MFGSNRPDFGSSVACRTRHGDGGYGVFQKVKIPYERHCGSALPRVRSTLPVVSVCVSYK